MPKYNSEFEKKFNKPPIIIGGCARSGTTLLLSILSAHPNIFGIPFETRAFCSNAYDINPKLSHSTNLEKIYHYFLTQDIPNNSRWCEKTPKNILFVKEILRYFQNNVRIFNIVRDGRDVILSRHPENPKLLWVPQERWINDVRAGLEFENIPQVMTLRYEDLVIDFDRTIKKIFEFINEDCGPDMSNWYKYTKIKEHEAWFEGVQPVSTKSIGKWKKFRHRKIIREFMKKPEAVALLKHYNYVS
ncbi:MAG: sulfotransferase [bacterium]|nr:sulfotransferase [bacterium]